MMMTRSTTQDNNKVSFRREMDREKEIMRREDEILLSELLNLSARIDSSETLFAWKLKKNPAQSEKKMPCAAMSCLHGNEDAKGYEDNCPFRLFRKFSTGAKLKLNSNLALHTLNPSLQISEFYNFTYRG